MYYIKNYIFVNMTLSTVFQHQYLNQQIFLHENKKIN